MMEALAQWLLLGWAEAPGQAAEAEAPMNTEALGERVPLAQPLAQSLASALAEERAEKALAGGLR